VACAVSWVVLRFFWFRLFDWPDIFLLTIVSFSPYLINLSFVDYSEESFALVPHKSLDVILLTQTAWSSTFLFVGKYFSTSLSSSLSLGATSSFSVSSSSSQFICSASLRVLRGCSWMIIALVGNIIGKEFEGFGASFRTCVIVYNHV
jgi:hypothetical protein